MNRKTKNTLDLIEKNELLKSIYDLERQGYTTYRHVDVNSTVEEIRYELSHMQNMRAKENTDKMITTGVAVAAVLGGIFAKYLYQDYDYNCNQNTNNTVSRQESSRPHAQQNTAQSPDIPSHKDGTCIVCMDAENDILFLGCSHLVCCSSCSTQISTCPICRKTIDQKIKVYKS